MLLHASGLVRSGVAWVFPGVSGAGKTTIVRQSPDLTVLSDEVVGIRLVHGQNGDIALAQGTPFFGDWGGPGEGITQPLRGFYFPIQDSENRVEPLSPRETLAGLLRCLFLYTESDRRKKRLFDHAASLAQAVPGFAFHFRPDSSFWQVLDE
ncbi:MAG TPA: hypothetical protein VIN67_01710 [Desulfobaccales bacterium]